MRIHISPGKERKLLRILGQITTRNMIREDELTEDEINKLIDVFDPWTVGEAVKVGDLRRYNNNLYECIQAHTTQSDWTPDITPALWKVMSAPDVIALWVQPAGAHDAYNTGDRVIWPEGGPVWESTIDANVWEPGVHGWVQV